MDLTSIYVSIVLIILGMIVGIIMAFKYIFKNKPIPRTFTILHGMLVASGVGILLIYNLSYVSFNYWKVLGLYLLTFLGGATLLALDLLGKLIPKLFVVGHATFALISLSAYFYYTF